ncbi:MAG: sodium/proton-translocating pyrophosphatase, partial [Thermoplasmata archaeon]
MIEIVIIVIALLALIYAGIQAFLILRESEGTEEMKKIAQAIQEGSKAFMKRQYTTISIVAIILVIIIFISLPNGLIIAFGFAIGALGSAGAGYIGMHISIRANVRTANKAKEGLQKAFSLALRGGSVTGLSVVGIALLGLSVFYFWLHNPEMLVGFVFGASLISLFARVGGGIYTKGADVGADLVGKVKYGIPEDDPRNPAVIADNVGDNVGDCAGMAADVFESFVVTIIAAMLLGPTPDLILLPLGIAAIGVLASLVGSFFVRLWDNKIMNAFYAGLAATAIIMLILTYLYSPIQYFYITLIGAVVTIALFLITEYYTGTQFGPVKKIAKASSTGSGTNLITGLAVGMESTFLPVLIIVIAIALSYKLGGLYGLYGVALAAAAMLSLSGMVISIDSYG